MGLTCTGPSRRPSAACSRSISAQVLSGLTPERHGWDAAVSLTFLSAAPCHVLNIPVCPEPRQVWRPAERQVWKPALRRFDAPRFAQRSGTIEWV